MTRAPSAPQERPPEAPPGAPPPRRATAARPSLLLPPLRASSLLCSLACAGALAACTPAAAPVMRSSGKIMALGGVAGIVGAVLATAVTPRARDLMVGFEFVSAVGVLSYAYADLTWPRVEHIQETPGERYHRWAKILTERAAGAAREGRCRRVRRLEVRVEKYDRVIHDGVFLKDPEILKCLAAPGMPAPGSPDVPGSPDIPGTPGPSAPPVPDPSGDLPGSPPADSPEALPSDPPRPPPPGVPPSLPPPSLLPPSPPDR